MTKPSRVKCFYCGAVVLDITCDEVEITHGKKVHRCQECNEKHKAAKKRAIKESVESRE